jgi:hypothetical protein
MSAKQYFCGRPTGERQDYKSRDRSQQRDNSLWQTNFPGRREESTHTLAEKGRENEFADAAHA